MSLSCFNGFDNGVIGKKLPADSTLNCMKKADLIKMLHLAESNHRVLAEAYSIAVSTSKCNTCPLHIDTRRAEQIRADAIEKFKQKLISYMTNYKPMYLNLLCVIEEIATELKEQKE